MHDVDNALGMEVFVWTNGWTGLVLEFSSSDKIYLSAACVSCLFFWFVTVIHPDVSNNGYNVSYEWVFVCIFCPFSCFGE